jgi:hypothetical protein
MLLSLVTSSLLVPLSVAFILSHSLIMGQFSSLLQGGVGQPMGTQQVQQSLCLVPGLRYLHTHLAQCSIHIPCISSALLQIR